MANKTTESLATVPANVMETINGGYYPGRLGIGIPVGPMTDRQARFMRRYDKLKGPVLGGIVALGAEQLYHWARGTQP